MKRLRFFTCLALGLCAISTSQCTGADRPPPASAREPARAALTALDYTVTLDAALSTISVRLCFHGAAPESLVYGSAASMRFLRNARLLEQRFGQPVPAADGGGEPALRVAPERIFLDNVPHDGCVGYDVDLAAALKDESILLAYLARGSVVTGVELFLFRPVVRPRDMRTSLRFVLPDGVQVSVPWRQREGRYTLDETAFAFTGHIAFGRFTREQIAVPGGVLDVAVLEGFPETTRALVAPWLHTAGSVVASATGVFPARSTQVLVVPTPAVLRPIRFGHTGRSGGPSILIFMPSDIDLAALRDDWIAIHEFCHLLHPFVRRQDAWLSEGLATYLQDVLRTRAGLMNREELWRRLYEGAELGKAADGTLEEETKIMPGSGNYQRVYWAGAAIAFIADVELRKVTAGKQTLDSVLMALTPLLEETTKPFGAEELLARMDVITGQQVFTSVAQRYLRSPKFPELSALYAELGLRADGRTRTDAAAPFAWIAEAIASDRRNNGQLSLLPR